MNLQAQQGEKRAVEEEEGGEDFIPIPEVRRRRHLFVGDVKLTSFFHQDFLKRSKQEADMSQPAQQQLVPSRVCYLRNLSYECTPQEIAALFGQWQPTKV
jgi:hypothetical protein